MGARATVSVRALARQVHLWLGLSLGVLFAVVGLTGSILMFYTDLHDALHPEIRLSGAASLLGACAGDGPRGLSRQDRPPGASR